MEVAVNSADVQVNIRAMTAAGVALEDKVAADFTLWYRRDGATVAISLSDLSELTDDHSDGGLLHIGDGWYRVDVPDAAFAEGVNQVLIGGSVSGGIVLSRDVDLRQGFTVNSEGSVIHVD